MSSDVRNDREAVGRNFGYNLSGQAVSLISGLVVNAVLARTFQPSGYGLLYSNLSLATMLLSLFSCGAHTSLNIIVLRNANGDLDYVRKVSRSVAVRLKTGRSPLLVSSNTK